MSPFLDKEQKIPSEQEPKLRVSDFFTGVPYASWLNAGLA